MALWLRAWTPLPGVSLQWDLGQITIKSRML